MQSYWFQTRSWRSQIVNICICLQISPSSHWLVIALWNYDYPPECSRVSVTSLSSCALDFVANISVSLHSGLRLKKLQIKHSYWSRVKFWTQAVLVLCTLFITLYLSSRALTKLTSGCVSPWADPTELALQFTSCVSKSGNKQYLILQENFVGWWLKWMTQGPP